MRISSTTSRPVLQLPKLGVALPSLQAGRVATTRSTQEFSYLLSDGIGTVPALEPSERSGAVNCGCSRALGRGPNEQGCSAKSLRARPLHSPDTNQGLSLGAAWVIIQDSNSSRLSGYC